MIDTIEKVWSNMIYINEITAVAGLGYFNKVLAERLGPENPFTDTATVCLGVFYFWRVRLIWQATGAKRGNYRKVHADYPFISRWQHRFESDTRRFKISGLKLFHPDCLNKVYEKSENQIERVKKFSPGMDFFSSSTY